MSLFDAFKKKGTVNPQQAQFQKVYSFVSSEKFSVCYNYVARRILNATTYQSTSTLNSEVKAVLEEKKIRENENINENVDNIVSIDDVKKITDGLFAENVRPEIVCKKITAAFKQIGTQNHIKPDLTDEFCREIEKMTNTFDEAFMRCVNISENSHKAVRAMSDQAYDERTSTGLGFGILTSSIGTAALYTIMNEHEHKRQLNAQNARINSSVNALDKGNGAVLYTSVMELYDAYQKDVNDILTSVQKILTNKNKLQEAEEKILQNRALKSDIIISRSAVPIVKAILSALYEVGKPYTVSELQMIDECSNYSNQNIFATCRRMFDSGVLGKDFKNKKTYFYPIPDSLEEAMEIMGITKKAIEGAKIPQKNNDALLDLNYGELESQMCSCPCCNKSVSVQAVACPDCGYPIKKNFYTNLYNQQSLEQGKITKKLYIVKLWILAQYFDMPVTELPRKVNQINTWVIENGGMLNRITENDVAALSKSPEYDYGKIKLFLKHEEELNIHRNSKR